jgi:DNA (cytosine-5)-methyltransferase 1
MRVLNLYAGIGGNRKLWTDVEVTAVELKPDIATIYKDLFPEDNVIVADAHEYLLKHYKEFDFIWSSPPCPTHSDIRRMAAMQGQYEAMYPDFKLWQEVTLLKHFSICKYVVENVKPYYMPIIPQTAEIDRHYFWTNFSIRGGGIFI